MMTQHWIDLKEYPFESNHLELEMGRMHYIDVGDGDVLLMVHGNPTWSFLYRHLVKRLSSNYRCVAPDNIGFGLSDKPADWSYLPKHHAANLEVFVDRLGLRDITLFVHDWGGPIGLSYAVNHPDNVKRLVIMNTWMWPVDDDPHYITFSNLLGGRIGRVLITRFNFFARVMVRQAFADKGLLTASIHRHYLQPLDKPERRKPSWVFPKEIIGSTSWLSELWSDRDKLAQIPTLILWGMRDIAFREQELNRWIELFPEAKVERMETVGHYVPEEATEEFYRAIEGFLEKTRQG